MLLNSPTTSTLSMTCIADLLNFDDICCCTFIVLKPHIFAVIKSETQIKYNAHIIAVKLPNSYSRQIVT